MLDVDAYLRRIQYTGSVRPNLENLNALVHAHVERIPFENVDVFLGQPLDVAPMAIRRKILEQGRGGYCFEQNGLFAEVLENLGFDIIRLGARVRIDRPRTAEAPQTHLFLQVNLDDCSYLADVGVGGLSPTCALRLELASEQTTPHEPRRLVAEGDWDGFERRAPGARLFHQAFYAGQWRDICEFTLEPITQIDCEIANWFTSAHPQSHFRSRLLVARTSGQERVTLLNRELKWRSAQGKATTQTLTSGEQVIAALRDTFGISLPQTSAANLHERLWADPTT